MDQRSCTIQSEETAIAVKSVINGAFFLDETCGQRAGLCARRDLILYRELAAGWYCEFKSNLCSNPISIDPSEDDCSEVVCHRILIGHDSSNVMLSLKPGSTATSVSVQFGLLYQQGAGFTSPFELEA